MHNDDGLRLLQPHAGAAESDAQLCRRVTAGDDRAFEALIDRHRGALRAACAAFRADDVDFDDLWQLATLALWRAVDSYDANRSAFQTFATRVVREALTQDLRARRRKKRWADLAPVSLDMPREEDDRDERLWIAPSWHEGADPAVVVMEREALALAWSALAQHHRDAVNAWLSNPDGDRRAGMTSAQLKHADAGRIAGRQVLDELRC